VALRYGVDIKQDATHGDDAWKPVMETGYVRKLFDRDAEFLAFLESLGPRTQYRVVEVLTDETLRSV
jgi:hypothetical protein